MRCQRDRDAPWVGDMVVLRRSRSQCYRTAPSAGVVQSATLNVVLAAASSRGGGKRRQAAAVQSGWRRCRQWEALESAQAFTSRSNEETVGSRPLWGGYLSSYLGAQVRDKVASVAAREPPFHRL